MSIKKYNIIYADPPWEYRTYSKKGKGRSAESHYPTMSIEQIKALPVSELAAPDCALFMWITFPCLYEALEVIEAWGFSYKTVAFVWVKQNRKADSLFWGMGYWTRANAELCIMATKGHPKRESSSVHQIIMSHVEEHSKKPDEARSRIVQLVGDLPRIELFARQSPEGWDVWGNEVDCSVSLEGKNQYPAQMKMRYEKQLTRKEVSHGICSGPERPDQSKDKGCIQPD
ncbi:hypothetical protein SDC9_36738 [bioreactor metagenome]|uniref:Adenine methyltransferase n=1 Tax=bioreactor metagenome TaxID=1076179 RepID=A0A644VJA7_9ZZZZ